MSRQQQFNDEPLDWLLEASDPGVRYLALRDLLDYSADEPVLIEAKNLAHTQGPISRILDKMDVDGLNLVQATTRNTSAQFGRSSCWHN